LYIFPGDGLRILLQWLITAAALLAAVAVVPGISVTSGGLLAVGVTAAVLGLVNAFLRPLLRLLGCGFIVITLGLFLLVINAFTLWLAARIADGVFHQGFHVNGFWPALLGGIIVSVVSWLLWMMFPGEKRRGDKQLES
jgi:putative membrane protein